MNDRTGTLRRQISFGCPYQVVGQSRMGHHDPLWPAARPRGVENICEILWVYTCPWRRVTSLRLDRAEMIDADGGLNSFRQAVTKLVGSQDELALGVA